MKKAVKKLTLCKETLRRMEANHLKPVAGASFPCSWYCETATNCLDVSRCVCA